MCYIVDSLILTAACACAIGFGVHGYIRSARYRANMPSVVSVVVVYATVIATVNMLYMCTAMDTHLREWCKHNNESNINDSWMAYIVNINPSHQCQYVRGNHGRDMNYRHTNSIIRHHRPYIEIFIPLYDRVDKDTSFDGDTDGSRANDTPNDDAGNKEHVNNYVAYIETVSSAVDVFFVVVVFPGMFYISKNQNQAPFAKYKAVFVHVYTFIALKIDTLMQHFE